MPLPVIQAATPVSTQPVPAKTYNQWFLTMLHVDALDASKQKYQAVANLSLGLQNADGSVELDPSTPQATLTIPDLYAAAATDADLANVMGAIVLYLIKLGKAEGIVPA